MVLVGGMKAARVGARRGAVVLVGVVIAMVVSSCSAPSGTEKATVTLLHTRPGEASLDRAVRLDFGAASVQVRLSSGTGHDIGVQVFEFTPLQIVHPGQPMTTVVDDGSGTWTTVGHAYPRIPNPPGFPETPPNDVALRLTTAPEVNDAVTIEVRGVDVFGNPIGSSGYIAIDGWSCGNGGPAGLGPYRDLTAINLASTDLRGCVLPGVTIDASQVAQTLLGGADLYGSTILPGPFNGGRIGGARLDHSTLAGVTFTGNNVLMDWTDFSDSNLDGLTATGPVLRFADFGGASLVNAVLTDVDLSGANLDGAVLSGATFAQVDLTGATGTPIYAGATFTDSTCPDGTSSAANGNSCQGHPWA